MRDHPNGAGAVKPVKTKLVRIRQTCRKLGYEYPVGRNGRTELFSAADLPVVKGMDRISARLDQSDEDQVVGWEDFPPAQQLPDLFELDAARRIWLALVGSPLLDCVNGFEVFSRVLVVGYVDAQEQPKRAFEDAAEVSPSQNQVAICQGYRLRPPMEGTGK
ncbi:hypothetical protein [Sinorhizobium meliloti]|uniref:hypothetical protein n=1 Tax=Rhizobium meliloti TaxID=382 RepID=UPI000FD8C9EC|nr:hypothetical protein [Sinorhizobium meliloti]RVO68334.1 hypothetical protein CN087_12715 [Sinorhizobium meliloti]